MTIHALPDTLNGFAVAHAVLDGKTADREVIEAACDILDCSEWYQDLIRVRNARARIGAEIIETRTSEDVCLHDLGRMAPHFEALGARDSHASTLRLAGIGFLIAAAVALVAHVAFAAPGKVARTLSIHQQIEEMR